MYKYMHEYGPAPESREMEARELFPYQKLTPEQYAAQEAHNWASFSFDEYIYRDPVLNEWIHTLGDILFTEGAVEAARNKYLSPETIESIKKEQSLGGHNASQPCDIMAAGPGTGSIIFPLRRKCW